MAAKKESLEQIMDQLNQVVTKLETESLTLEESYQCFSSGVDLVAKGNKAIDQVEKQIKVLTGQEAEADVNP